MAVIIIRMGEHNCVYNKIVVFSGIVFGYLEYLIILLLFHLGISCTVVVLNCFVVCGCFGNVCTCIYCVLYCLYCVFCIVSFMYMYSY